MSRRRRTLTDEDLALWRQVASSTRKRGPAPLAPASLRAGPAAPDPRPETETETAIPAPTIMTAPLTGAGAPLKPMGRPGVGLTLPEAPRPGPSGLDRRTETRLRKGKRDPDARLDLHGMTARDAHAALSRFIGQSRMVGHRMVLVITGKGAPGPSRSFGDPAPGVLRRETPVWLSTPPLAAMVVNVTQAHPKHGGGGALYVYLKRVR